jgi:hypothetical protein
MAKTAIKAGGRFKSAVCETQVMVIKAPASEFALSCGGVDMLGTGATAPASAALDSAHAAETLIGKRYVNADESLELLCTKGGKGSLALDGVALQVKQAKQLPSSD